MSVKTDLIAGLNKRRNKAIHILSQVESDMVVHPDSGWTVRDLIAHLTSWEVHTVRVLQAYLKGEIYSPPDFRPDRVDEFNEKELQATAHINYDGVVAQWKAIRTELLDTIDFMTEAQLLRSFMMWGVYEMPVIHLVKGMGKHERDHIQEIANASMIQQAQSISKAEVLESLSRSQQYYETELRDVDREMVVHPDSGWRVKDLMGHVADWENQMYLSIRAYVDGSAYSMADFNDSQFSMDDLNGKWVEKRKDESVEMIWADWRKTRQEMIDLVTQIPEERFTEFVIPPWNAKKPIPLALLAMDAVAHEKEHSDEIIEAMKQ